ncbi:MAG: hypothetical protein LWW85_12805 [Marinilabiliales bacterium]|nr:hypothetical protein [Marinilabiliales bacterium]
MKELEKSELMAINGGANLGTKVIKGGFWGVIAAAIIEHWTEVKSGIIDGWNDAMAD